MRTVLVVVDMQRDFIHGSLRVSGAEVLLPAIVRAAKKSDYVIATRDWHPRNHQSFKSEGGPFPKHCVAGSTGAKIHYRIDQQCDAIFSKGRRHDIDGFSAGDNRAFLASVYEEAGSSGQVIVCGVAYEYCVAETALSIRQQLGLEVSVPNSLTASMMMVDKIWRADEKLSYVGIQSFAHIGDELIP